MREILPNKFLPERSASDADDDKSASNGEFSTYAKRHNKKYRRTNHVLRARGRVGTQRATFSQARSGTVLLRSRIRAVVTHCVISEWQVMAIQVSSWSKKVQKHNARSHARP